MRMQKNICERDHICDPATCSCKKGNYLQLLLMIR